MKTTILSFTLLFALTPINAQDQIKKNKKILEKIETLTQKKLFNPQLLESEEWKKFMGQMDSQDVLSLETREFAQTFNLKAEALSFSHYYIGLTKKEATPDKKKLPAFELEEVSNETAILHIRKFIPDGAAMEAIVQEIQVKNYHNLIIDLRNNSGGTLDGAVILGRYLTNKTIDAGAYVTRKWYDEKGNTPTKKEIQNFQYLKGFTYKDFQDIQDEPAFRMVIPGHSGPTFQGKVFVLTNNNTASACEPFVHLLKVHDAATIIGETTAGQMLSANWFRIDKNISIFIPTNDYITAEGLRLDKVGVEPHIKTTSEEALNTALENLQ